MSEIIDWNEFLNQAKGILEQCGKGKAWKCVDDNHGIFEFNKKRIALAKQINLAKNKNEFIAVMIFKGTKKEIKEMYHNK